MMIFAWVLTALAFIAGLIWTFLAVGNSPNPALCPVVWLGLIITLLAVGMAFILIVVMSP